MGIKNTMGLKAIFYFKISTYFITNKSIDIEIQLASEN